MSEQQSKKARAGRAGIRLVLTRTLWGILDWTKPEQCEPSYWEPVFEKLQKEGYEAIEHCVGPFCAFNKHPEEARKLLAKYNLRFVGQVHTCSYPISSRKVADHVESFRTLVTEAKEKWGAQLVNVHSGCDSWSLEDSLKFFRECLKIEKSLGIKVVHETHRRRVFFHPWITRDILRKLPELKVNADLSHFVVVGERIYDDGELDPEWPEILELISQRCHLIHARVGYAEGPQVPHPAAPEYEAELTAHEKWWASIWNAAAARGDKEIFCEPEHGPNPYLQALPYTRQPLADLWEVNSFIGRRLQNNFAAWQKAK